jgi:ATP-binding cassette, subfamily C (CFTR/MRP), member 1
MLTIQFLTVAVLGTKTVNLVLWVKYPVTRYTTTAASITLAGAIGLTALVLLEHARSNRPSTIISIYLLTQVMADSVVVRTLKLRSHSSPIINATWASICFQLALLILESTTKRSHLNNPTQYGVEETSGILDRSIVGWLNTLFWRGKRHVLIQSDLFQLDSGLRSGRLRDRIVLTWDHCKT